MTRYINMLPILMVLLLFSCSKDEDTFTPTQSSTQYSATLTGLVLDTNNEPILGAEIYYNGYYSTTGTNGVYEFKNVPVDSKHNVISITKEGYFESGRTFRSKQVAEITHQTTLLLKTPSLSFASEVGGIVEKDGVKIEFTPNSIVYDGSQDVYNGNVNVAITYLDPTDRDLESKMPGDGTSFTSDNTIHKSTSFGMAYVELQDNNGIALQIKEGKVAKLHIEVPDEILNFAPQILEASHFDQKLGAWKHETKAYLDGNTYISEVTHFSCWSYNSSAPAIVITGRIVDDMGQPVPGVHIQISEYGNWTGGYGYTDQNGVFTGAVPKDEELKLYVNNTFFCTGTAHLLDDRIGPFANDINLGDLMVDVSALDFVTVDASFYNCDGELVTNGIAYAAHSLFKITNGKLNVTIPVCDNGYDLILWAHDLDSDKVSERLPLVINQVNSYNDYSLCQIEARYMEVYAPGLGIDETTMIEIVAGFTGVDKNIFGLYNSTMVSDWGQLKLNYSDDETSGFKVGTWDISSGTIEVGAFPAVLTYAADSGEGEVTITHVGTDGLGKYIKGNYRVDFKDVNTGTVYEFSGNFNLLTN